jgi:hypothetical protein
MRIRENHFPGLQACEWKKEVAVACNLLCAGRRVLEIHRRRKALGVETGDEHSAIRKMASRQRRAVQMVDGMWMAKLQ